MTDNTKTHVILLSCGSFNPITKGHIHMFEKAREYLHKTGKFIVIGGIISPVHDSYGKPRVTGCILSNVNTPSTTPVIGQPQNETQTGIYQNHNTMNNKPIAIKLWGKMSESLGKICCVRPNIDRFTFVDENANLGTAMRYEEIELRILLLCGSDLLESFCIPGLWKDSDMEVIVGDFGIVVVPRDGVDTERIMNHSSVLRKNKDNITVVKHDANHPMSIVSSTKSRLALQHGDGHVVDYLNQTVIDYILQSQLYINASG
ncbi:unnamed protein product [Coregonus sp. 'balchen']|nr:unnamed protein product [Coregonus sp. 'balchen']